MTELRVMFARLSLFDYSSLLAELQVKLTWIGHIREKQLRDESLVLRFRQVENGSRVHVPSNSDLRQSTLREAHSSPYVIHPCGNKMYRDLRELYWWLGLKGEVTNFVTRYLTCQQVQAKHQLSLGLLQPVKIPLGLELVFDTKDKVRLIQDHLKAASDRQKSYADLKRRDIERYQSDPSHIVSVEEIKVRLDLTFEEEPVQILDRDIKVLRRKSIPLVKVLWQNHGIEEATLEPEDLMH
ncbi:uncharacterized protein LOC108487720 [Gossypium arboreum]|uniref:uncharacterized protein LOC108487720 n=1 Tax=Gossypium arboreum TaxID=29729 RepID=UPI00081941F1|nr:uncharacterized protein LOC108487720 [Gossypium arboreum]